MVTLFSSSSSCLLNPTSPSTSQGIQHTLLPQFFCSEVRILLMVFHFFWAADCFEVRKLKGENGDNNSDDNNFECYTCTQIGVPVFHSTSCDHAHHPKWEASAGSSLVLIQNLLHPKNWLPSSGRFGPVLDPRSHRVQRLNRPFLMARAMSSAVDTLFFYALSIGRGLPRVCTRTARCWHL